MKRVVNFYEKLPRGAAPEVKATGILGRYQAKHFGKNPSAMRTYQEARLHLFSGICLNDLGMLTGLPSSHHPRYRLPCHHWIRSELLLPSA